MRMQNKKKNARFGLESLTPSKSSIEINCGIFRCSLKHGLIKLDSFVAHRIACRPKLRISWNFLYFLSVPA